MLIESAQCLETFHPSYLSSNVALSSFLAAKTTAGKGQSLAQGSIADQLSDDSEDH